MLKTKEIPTNFGRFKSMFSQNSNFDKKTASKGFFVELLVILGLAAVTYIVWAALWIKFSRAEVFFAECAREMIVTNNMVTPLYHAQPFFDKPIFVYWLIITMFKTIGINHFAARLPNIVASLVTIAATAWGGAKLFGKRAGLLAAFMLASSFMYLSFSSLCMSDMFLVMFDTLSLAAIYAGIVSEKNRSKFWRLAAVSMGFAFLTKGPVGIVLPALTTLIYLGLQKKLNIIKANHIGWGLLIIAVVASPWFYAAYLANGPQSMVHFFIQENLQRFAGSTYDVHKPFWYTIISFFTGFAPWSVLIPPALFFFGKDLIKSKNKTIEEKAEAQIQLSAELFLWLWVFISVGFFCFSRGKCDYYTMPSFTAAAILASHFAVRYLAKYCSTMKALAVSVLAAIILFATLALPQINQLLPIAKYAAMIKNSPGGLKIGIDDIAASWIDEILFQSGKDSQRLSSTQDIDKFITKTGPTMLILPQNKYDRLSPRQKQEFQIISLDKVSTHPLTPGYVISRSGDISDSEPLVVAVNYGIIKQ